MPQDAMHSYFQLWNLVDLLEHPHLQVFRKDQLLPLLCQLQSLKKLGKPTVAKRKLKVLANSASAFHR